MRTIEELTEENIKLKKILSHIFADKSQKYFICGESVSKDDLDLPDTVYICPIYGSNVVVAYKKV